MQKYQENEQKRDELYAEQKLNRLGNAKTRGAPVAAPASTPTDMFGGEDLAIARKKERAAEAEKTNTLEIS